VVNLAFAAREMVQELFGRLHCSKCNHGSYDISQTTYHDQAREQR